MNLKLTDDEYLGLELLVHYGIVHLSRLWPEQDGNGNFIRKEIKEAERLQTILFGGAKYQNHYKEAPHDNR